VATCEASATLKVFPPGYGGEGFTLSDQSKVSVARVALFAPDTIRLYPVKLPRSDLS
jgi:hypothetical protein